MQAQDDFASMLLTQGAQLTLHSMREKYPNKAVLRNMIRRARIAALQKMHPFEQFTAQEIGTRISSTSRNSLGCNRVVGRLRS